MPLLQLVNFIVVALNHEACITYWINFANLRHFGLNHNESCWKGEASDRESRLDSPLTMLTCEDKVKAAVWMVYPLVAVCLVRLRLARRRCAALPARGASCGLFLFNHWVLPRSIPYSSPEMKCDFHFFYSSEWMLSSHLCRDSVPGMFSGLLSWRFKCWLAAACPLRYLCGSCLQEF